MKYRKPKKKVELLKPKSRCFGLVIFGFTDFFLQHQE